MLPAFASFDDLRARTPGGIDNAEVERAQAALDDASSLIRAEADKTWTTTTDDETVLVDDLPGILVTVCCSAARRSLENPEGVSQESLGSYSVSHANVSNDVYLTSAERRAVRRAAGRGSIGAIPISRGPIETPACGETTYLPVSPAGQDMPFSYEPLNP